MRQPWKPMRRDEGEPMGQTGTDGTIYIYIIILVVTFWWFEIFAIFSDWNKK